MPRARVALLLLPCVAAYVAPRRAHCAPVRVAPRAAALAMSSAHIQVLSRSTHDDGTLDGVHYKPEMCETIVQLALNLALNGA